MADLSFPQRLKALALRSCRRPEGPLFHTSTYNPERAPDDTERSDDLSEVKGL